MDYNRMQKQRGQRPPVPHGRVDVKEVFEDNEYDEMWPERTPSSALSYQRLADVEDRERPRGDVQSSHAVTRSFRTTTNPGREREVNTGYPSRRPGTTTQIPATSPSASGISRKTGTYANLPASASQISRRTGTYGSVSPSASQIGRRTTTPVPASQVKARTMSPRPMPSQSAPVEKPKRRFNSLVYIGLAMLAMVLGWVLLANVASWWHTTQDDITYGHTRTAHFDAVVGHNDSDKNPSHFIATNVDRKVSIVEFPGGDASKAKIYIGPTLIGQDQDQAPVTLTFADVNGDSKPDMIVNIQDGRFVFINEKGSFRPLKQGETVHLP